MMNEVEQPATFDIFSVYDVEPQADGTFQVVSYAYAGESQTEKVVLAEESSDMRAHMTANMFVQPLVECQFRYDFTDQQLEELMFVYNHHYIRHPERHERFFSFEEFIKNVHYFEDYYDACSIEVPEAEGKDSMTAFWLHQKHCYTMPSGATIFSHYLFNEK